METNIDNNKHLVPIAIVVAGALIAGAVYFGGSNTGSYANNPETTKQAEVPEVTSSDHIFGNPNAPIVVVEYSDIECPFCKVFHSTMHQIVEDYDGKVAWVYRQFPIAQLHANAPIESEATECAYELGGNTAFWKYLDLAFETTNSNNSLDLAELPRMAGAIGLDVNAFNTCLSSGKYTAFIKTSVENAVKAGARGTPHSVIIAQDGTQVIINGAEPYANVKDKIDALLK